MKRIFCWIGILGQINIKMPYFPRVEYIHMYLHVYFLYMQIPHVPESSHVTSS